jgi:hypothetical protein
MRYIITESQLKKIQSEQITRFERYLDRAHATPERAEKEFQRNKELIQDLKKLRAKNEIIFDTVAQLGMWFIPMVGPYLSTAYGSAVAISKLKEGKYIEGIIGLITSPLALAKSIRVLQLLGGSSKSLKMLEAINKSGLPVLVSQGQQKFLEWGVKNFGDDFIKLTNLLMNKSEMEKLLKSLSQKTI